MLYVITWITDFAAFLVVFTVSRQLAEQGAGAFFTGVVGTLFALAAALSSAVAGHLADRAGRRPVAVAGAALLLFSIPCLALFGPGDWAYLMVYSAAGAALGMIYPPVIAWLSLGRRGRSTRRAYLGFCLAFNAGIVCGQMAGGWLFAEAGPAHPLALAFILIALDLVLLLWMPESPAVGAAQCTAGEPETSFPDRARSLSFARLCWVANAGGTFSYSIVLYLFPKLSVDLELSAGQQGLMLGLGRLATVATFFAMYATTFWVHRFGVAVIAQALGIVGLLGLVIAVSGPGLVASLSALSILVGYNYYAGLYYSTSGSAADRQATGGGTHEATLALGLAAGSLCGGIAGSVGGAVRARRRRCRQPGDCADGDPSKGSRFQLDGYRCRIC